MSTVEFKTKSLVKDWKMPKINGNNQFKERVIVGIDGGYSSVKAITGDRIVLFPSYAKKLPPKTNLVADLAPTHILLRNNITGELWAIGELAETLIDSKDVENTTDDSLFSRYHYDNEIYKVIMTAGIAISLERYNLSKSEIFIQTGLPCDYMRDSAAIMNVLSGKFDVSIRVGASPEKRMIFEIDRQCVNVMEQPKGTMLSAVYDKNGLPIKERIGILSSKTLIDDIGFGTEDTYAIRAGVPVDNKTFTDTAMRSVFDETLKSIDRETGDSYKIFEFQKYLEKGTVPTFDRSTTKLKPFDFSNVLEEANKNACKKSIDHLLERYDNLLDYQFLIVTGGTGESRFEMMKEALSGIDTLTVVAGNENAPELPFVFSNVRGYYMAMYLRLLQQQG